MIYQTPVLTDDKTQCLIGELTLSVNQPVDYKSAGEDVVSIGKITDFKYAGYDQQDRESVWMQIADMGRKAVSEWVSVRLWKSHYDAGIFKPIETKPEPQTTQPPANDSSTQYSDDDLPF